MCGTHSKKQIPKCPKIGYHPPLPANGVKRGACDRRKNNWFTYHPPPRLRFGFHGADFGRFLAGFGPILAIFGHFLTTLGTMGGGGRPPTHPHVRFGVGGTRPPINIGTTPIPPMGVLRSWAIPPVHGARSTGACPTGTRVLRPLPLIMGSPCKRSLPLPLRARLLL